LLRFEWNQWKAERNLCKHGISFEEASSVFADPLSITISDPDHSGDEHRFVTLGVSKFGRSLVVVHTERDDAIRLVSARIPTKAEKARYEEDTK
jgi:uncharacterized DUF497 family protein